MPLTHTATRTAIENGHTSLGIELGSTRIKAVLIGPDHRPIAAGSHTWENEFVDRTWTYSLDNVWAGLRACYADLADDVRDRHHLDLTTVGTMGISAMMHGYLPFDADGVQLTAFRTWRNTNTAPAAEQLSDALERNIPHRWSIAHLYQAMLDREDHVAQLAHLTTLAGYVHWQLTGQQVLGVGEASGMFPIDVSTGGYDTAAITTFERLAAAAGTPVALIDVLPTVMTAGDNAGFLTEDGAKLLDPTGLLAPGTPLCPPEGDAGTGMVATNSVAPRTGNVSAGTSIFAMVVLETPLSRPYKELDLVTTPAGDLVAMVHCNNGASELNAWVGLFTEFAALSSPASDVQPGQIFAALFAAARRGDPDGGGLLAYNYLSGEPITGLHEGRPLFLRSPDSTLNLANFMRTQLFSVFATLRVGMDVLAGEGVGLNNMFAHGGLFTTPGVAQELLAAALRTPVSVGDIAAEGGAWGIAVLAAYTAARGQHDSLTDFLTRQVFPDANLNTVEPNPTNVAGFASFMIRYLAALPVEQAAVTHS